MHPLGDESKTRIVPPQCYFDFLGLRFAPRSIRPVQKKLKQVYESIQEITDPKNIKKSLATVIQEINWLLQGFAHAYDFCNLTKGDLRGIDKHVGFEVRLWLKRRDLIRQENHVSASAFEHLGVRRIEKFRIDPIVKIPRLKAV
jgi:hypothetical protein